MRIVLAIFALGIGVAPARAADCVDASALADARAAVASACDCEGALTHATYVRCAAGVLRARVAGILLPRECLRPALRCARRSTCGRPGATTCCRIQHDQPRCTIKSSVVRCLATGGCAGSVPSCCDACDAGGCATATTSSTSTSSTSSTTTSSTSTSTPSTTVPVCGNGIVEAGEQCDSPLAFCDASCQGKLALCCQVGPFCGQVISTSGCFLNGGHLYYGRACVGSTCVGQAMPPTSVCCPLAGSCVDAIVSSSEQLGSFIFECDLAGGPDTGQVPTGTCGADGVCVAAP